jgi:hypothetical protein
MFMGHANISTAFDLYGHLMPGGEDAAVALIDADYERELTRSADTGSRPTWVL